MEEDWKIEVSQQFLAKRGRLLHDLSSAESVLMHGWEKNEKKELQEGGTQREQRDCSFAEEQDGKEGEFVHTDCFRLQSSEYAHSCMNNSGIINLINSFIGILSISE